MKDLILFGILSILIIIVSWRTLFNTKSHGFYRFFSWECIAWLFASNYRFWFDDFFSFHQIFSWVLLLVSIYLVVAGVIQLKSRGQQANHRDEKSLYQFEKTSELVDNGIYKYIRHPLYSSLLFLTWGIVIKNPTYALLMIAVLSSVFLYITARFDEKECINFFGSKYAEYMKRSKMFVPLLF